MLSHKCSAPFEPLPLFALITASRASRYARRLGSDFRYGFAGKLLLSQKKIAPLLIVARSIFNRAATEVSDCPWHTGSPSAKQHCQYAVSTCSTVTRLRENTSPSAAAKFCIRVNERSLVSCS